MPKIDGPLAANVAFTLVSLVADLSLENRLLKKHDWGCGDHE
jgi:hypothetical protein